MAVPAPGKGLDSTMFEGFESGTIDTGEAAIRFRRGGAGPPVLLLHGHPQTHVMWHGVAPRLAPDFTVVATDLRGYGDSSKPPTTEDHEPYSKRAMGVAGTTWPRRRRAKTAAELTSFFADAGARGDELS